MGQLVEERVGRRPGSWRDDLPVHGGSGLATLHLLVGGVVNLGLRRSRVGRVA